MTDSSSAIGLEMSPHMVPDVQAANTSPHMYQLALQSTIHDKSDRSVQPRGLGLYDCPLSSEAQGAASVLSTVSSSSSSSAAAVAATAPEDWDQSILERQITTASAPEMFSSFYNPFTSFSEEPQSLYPTTASTSCDSAVPELSYSRTPSRSLSCRSSVSSEGPLETSRYTTKQESFTPRLKMENSGDWTSDMPMNLNGAHSETMGNTSMPFSQSMSAHSTSWPASFASPNHYYPPLETPSYTSSSSSTSYQPSPEITDDAGRTRKTRKMTTASEANHICQTCGKPFSRSYNYKAHLETHDPSREYPYLCKVEGCNKKFVRKTDHDRHYSSVHLKSRNFQCRLCGNLFARKDTLRRHTEDGCSKRLEIASKSLRTPSIASSSSPEHQSTRSYDSNSSNGAMRPAAGGVMGLLPPLSSPPNIMLTAPLPPLPQPTPFYTRDMYQQGGPQY